MQNLYNINDFTPGNNYYKNEIVRVLDTQYGINNYLYYYSLYSHTAANSFISDASNWGGIIYDNAEVKPQFIWKPSYNWGGNNTPRIKSVSFGDGYQQISPDGINNLLINLDLSFENRDSNEYVAILHFLQSQQGAKSFIYIAPAPRNIIKRYVCKDWKDRQNFYNNYSIQAVFEEVVF